MSVVILLQTLLYDFVHLLQRLDFTVHSLLGLSIRIHVIPKHQRSQILLTNLEKTGIIIEKTCYFVHLVIIEKPRKVLTTIHTSVNLRKYDIIRQKLYFKLSDFPDQFAIKSNMTQHVAIFDIFQQYLINNASFLLDSNLNKHFSDTFQAPVTYSNLYIYHHHHKTVALLESITIIPNANTPNFIN